MEHVRFGQREYLGPGRSWSARLPVQVRRRPDLDSASLLSSGAFAEPSDGLEPSTPSLPWRFPGGIGVHGRALAITFLLQIRPLGYVSNARACPRVPKLMYPSRTRAALSNYKTANGSSPIS